MKTIQIEDRTIELPWCDHCRVEATEDDAVKAVSTFFKDIKSCKICGKGFKFEHFTLVHEKTDSTFVWLAKVVGTEDVLDLWVRGDAEIEEFECQVHKTCFAKRIPELCTKDILKKKPGRPERAEQVQGAPATDGDKKRFWDKVNKTDDCWIWKGAKAATGYGSMRWRGKSAYAHHVSLELVGRPFGRKVRAAWNCDNKKLCVRPEHLVDETSKEKGA